MLDSVILKTDLKGLSRSLSSIIVSFLCESISCVSIWCSIECLPAQGSGLILFLLTSVLFMGILYKATKCDNTPAYSLFFPHCKNVLVKIFLGCKAKSSLHVCVCDNSLCCSFSFYTWSPEHTSLHQMLIKGGQPPRTLTDDYCFQEQ